MSAVAIDRPEMTQRTDEFPVIVWLDGSLSNPHWVVDRAEMVLGREEGCDIVIPVRQISRQHPALDDAGRQRHHRRPAKQKRHLG